MSLLVLRKSEFLEDDLGMNQLLKIDNQERFPVIHMYSMCEEALQSLLISHVILWSFCWKEKT